MSAVIEVADNPVQEEKKTETQNRNSVRYNRIEEELGGAPDPMVFHRALHPEDNTFGYNDRCCLRFD